MAMSNYYHKKKFSDLRGKMVKSGQFDPVYQSGPSTMKRSFPNPEHEYGPSGSKKHKSESSSSLDSLQTQSDTPSARVSSDALVASSGSSSDESDNAQIEEDGAMALKIHEAERAELESSPEL